MAKEKQVIGREVTVDFSEVKKVPAKVDTGADSSAIWASDIFVDESHVLHYKLFDKKSPYYTGIEHTTTDYTVARTRSSLGEVAIKYLAKITIRLAGRKIKVKFGLSERSAHKYPILIGRRTLHGKFIVDVSQSAHLVKNSRDKTKKINTLMKKNPYKFFKEHYLKGKKK